MTYHKYYCNKCKEEFELNITPVEVDIKGYVNRKKGYEVNYLVSSLTESQIIDLPMEKDPRDYEMWETIKVKEIPDTPPCNTCGCLNTEKLIPKFHGRVGGQAMTRTEVSRYLTNGMDKQQAERFYKESIEASKERIGTMKEVYKPVGMDLDYMRKNGHARRVSDKRALEKKKQSDELGKMLLQKRDNKNSKPTSKKK